MKTKQDKQKKKKDRQADLIAGTVKEVYVEVAVQPATIFFLYLITDASGVVGCNPNFKNQTLLRIFS